MLLVSTYDEERRYHHGDLHAALLAAAQELLVERGEGAISLREVARRAAVSHNAPYRHFADRETLLAALAAQGFADLLACMGQIGAGQAAVTRLALLGRCYVHFALERRGLFRLMFASALERSRYPDLQQAAEQLRQLLGEAVAALVGEEAAEVAGLSAWSLVHGLALLLLDGQVAVAAEQMRLIEQVTGRFAEGLQALASQPG